MELPPKRCEYLWICALASPPITVVATFLLVLSRLSTGHGSEDFLGFGRLIAIVAALVLACVLSAVLTIASFVRRERLRGWSLVWPAWFLLAGGVLFLVDQRDRERIKQAEQRYSQYIEYHLLAVEQIQADPMIGLKERWYNGPEGSNPRSEARFDAMALSFQTDMKTPYDAEMLRQVYESAPQMRPFLFEHPSCTAEFLEAHFQEAWETASSENAPMKPRFNTLIDLNSNMLRCIVSHPNCPLPLVERVANSHLVRTGWLFQARDILARRQQNESTVKPSEALP